ncbi:protein phosphatase CheZ, partial [Burkholderia cenocepacia]|nr:protein phosphatase CheZ [Burkholderia cenocepacia]
AALAGAAINADGHAEGADYASDRILARIESRSVRVLNAIEIAKPMQERIQNEAEALDARWAQWYAAPIEHADVR